MSDQLSVRDAYEAVIRFHAAARIRSATGTLWTQHGAPSRLVVS
jgi:hypothetical protein